MFSHRSIEIFNVTDFSSFFSHFLSSSSLFLFCGTLIIILLYKGGVSPLPSSTVSSSPLQPLPPPPPPRSRRPILHRGNKSRKKTRGTKVFSLFFFYFFFFSFFFPLSLSPLVCVCVLFFTTCFCISLRQLFNDGRKERIL